MPIVPELAVTWPLPEDLACPRYTIRHTAGFGGVHLPEGGAVMCISTDESSTLEEELSELRVERALIKGKHGGDSGWRLVPTRLTARSAES